MRLKHLSSLLIFAFLIGFAAPSGAARVEEPTGYKKVAEYGKGYLELAETSYGDFYIIHLKGTHYEMGKQYGYLLGGKIAEARTLFTGYVKEQLGFAPEQLEMGIDLVWKHLSPNVPAEFHEEMRGIVDGGNEAGAKLKKTDLIVPLGVSNISDMYDHKVIFYNKKGSLPDMRRFAFTCSSFAAWGSRTEGGKLFASRDLDWAHNTGTDNYKLITVFEPYDNKGKRLNAYVTAGYIGMIGAVDGMNEKGITLGEIGAVNTVETLDGMPWTILFRKVLENSSSLGQALQIIRKAKNTVGYNFVVGDGDAENYGKPGWAPRGAAVEENGKFTAVFFDNDPGERKAVWIDAAGKPVLSDGKPTHYGTPMKDAIFRADSAMDPRIRQTQDADNGPADPQCDGNPLNGGSYQKRHKPQYDALFSLENGTEYVSKFDGKVLFPAGKPREIGAAEAVDIAQSVAAPDGNILSVVYAATDLELYVAYEDERDKVWTAAPSNGYVRLTFKRLLNREE